MAFTKSMILILGSTGETMSQPLDDQELFYEPEQTYSPALQWPLKQAKLSSYNFVNVLIMSATWGLQPTYRPALLIRFTPMTYYAEAAILPHHWHKIN
ncbi:hypothetical protein BX600DRAFT_52542 [Xylariales sp. PMI_506]|nr:hypothetical protein BX600DRAFT_52542 [Xylariales sp. PMI_506]